MDVDPRNEEASGGGGLGENESGAINQGGVAQNESVDNQGGETGHQDDDIKQEEGKISGDNDTSRYSYKNYLQSLPSQFPSPNRDADGDVDVSGTKQVVEKNTATLPALESVTEGQNTNNNDNNKNNNNNNMVPTSFIVPKRTQYSASNNQNDDNREVIDLCDSPPLDNKKILVIGGAASATSPFMTEEQYINNLYTKIPVLKHLKIAQQQLVINILKINPDADYMKLIQDVVWSSTVSSSRMNLQRQTFKNDDADIKHMKTEINLISEQSTSSKQRKKNKEKQINANLVDQSSDNLLNDDDNDLILPAYDPHHQQRTRNILNSDNQLPLASHHHHHQQQQQQQRKQNVLNNDNRLRPHHHDQQQQRQQSADYTEEQKDALFFQISGLQRDRTLPGYDEDDDDLLDDYIPDKTRNLSGFQLEQRRYSVQMYYYLMHPEELGRDLKVGDLIFGDYTLEDFSEEELYAEMRNHLYEYPELTITEWNNIKRFILNCNPIKDDGEYKYEHEAWVYYQKQLIVKKQLLFCQPSTYYEIIHILKQGKRKTNTKKQKEGRSKKRISSSSTTKRGSLTSSKSSAASSFSTPTSSTTKIKGLSLPIPFDDDKSAISQFMIAASKETQIKLKTPDSADPHSKGQWKDDGFKVCAALSRQIVVDTPAILNDALCEIAVAHLSFLDLLKTKLKRRIYWDVRIPILYTIKDAREREQLFLQIRSDGIKRLSSIARCIDHIKTSLVYSFRATAGALRTEWKKISDWYDNEWKPGTNRNCNTAGLNLLQQLGLLYVVDPNVFDFFIDDCIHSTVCNRERFHGSASQKHIVLTCDLNHPAKYTGQGSFVPSNSKGNNLYKTHLEGCNKNWQTKSKQITRITAKINAFCDFFEKIISKTAKHRQSLAHSMTRKDIKKIYDYIFQEDVGFKIQFNEVWQYVHEKELNKIDNEDKYRNSKIFKGKRSSSIKNKLPINMDINTIMRNVYDEIENNDEENDDFKIEEIITDDDDDGDINLKNNQQKQPQTKRPKKKSIKSTTDKSEMDADDDEPDTNNELSTARQIPPLPEKTINALKQQQRNKRLGKETKTKNKNKS